MKITYKDYYIQFKMYIYADHTTSDAECWRMLWCAGHLYVGQIYGNGVEVQGKKPKKHHSVIHQDIAR